MTQQIDPIQSISIALRDILLPMGFKHVRAGWPDSKFSKVDGNLPSLYILEVSDTGSHKASRESVHATVENTDGVTATVYKERLRKTFLLQLSVFTSTPEDRSNLGWLVEQYLVDHPLMQIGIPGVETSLFKYKGRRDPPGETGFYQRDIMFEATARVLSSESAQIAKTVSTTQN